MSISAFGIEHGGISKAELNVKPNAKPNGGRMATGTYFGWMHSAAAGRKGAKLKAVGSSAGHGVVGDLAGTSVGRTLGGIGGAKGRAIGGALGAGAGMLGGQARAVVTNSRKGRYKPESAH
jgi:hypothetical protein